MHVTVGTRPTNRKEDLKSKTFIGENAPTLYCVFCHQAFHYGKFGPCIYCCGFKQDIFAENLHMHAFLFIAH